jgi:hypothetical protein
VLCLFFGVVRTGGIVIIDDKKLAQKINFFADWSR